MRILKTFRGYNQTYLECEYRNKCPTYWIAAKEMDIWSSSMPEEIRTYTPIGYVHNQTNGKT